MELNFSSDLDSAKRLDEIMNSYSGRDRGSILADEHSMVVTLFLLEHGKITVTEHTYSYDQDIQSDSEMMEVYSELARETRWKQFAHTEIERIRINALRQMRQEGKPSYDGEFMCWREGRVFAHCGNLMSRRNGSIFLPIHTGRRITQRNTTASTCPKPPSKARGSTVNPSGRNCGRRLRPALSPLHSPNRRTIRRPRHKNTKTNQSQSATDTALWLFAFIRR